ncbi:MAG: hypothetical protein R2882_08420 [Gemmatimonadales bacterium]
MTRQVAAIRLRWEREKRKAVAAPEDGKKTRKRAPAKKKEAKEEAAAEAQEDHPGPQGQGGRNRRARGGRTGPPGQARRTAAEVAETEAAQAEAEKAALESESRDQKPLFDRSEPAGPTAPMQSIQERAKALFKDLPQSEAEPAPAETEPEAQTAAKPEPPPPPALPPIPPRLPRPTLEGRRQGRAPAAVRSAAGPATADRPPAGLQQHSAAAGLAGTIAPASGRAASASGWSRAARWRFVPADRVSRGPCGGWSGPQLRRTRPRVAPPDGRRARRARRTTWIRMPCRPTSSRRWPA